MNSNLKILQPIEAYAAMVNAENAREWLKNLAPNYRKPKRGVVESYKAMMLSNNWEPCADSLKFNSEMQLVDGRMRLMALLAAAEVVPEIEIGFSIWRGVSVSPNIDRAEKRTDCDAIFTATGITREPCITGALKFLYGFSNYVKEYKKSKVNGRKIPVKNVLMPLEANDVFNEHELIINKLKPLINSPEMRTRKMTGKREYISAMLLLLHSPEFGSPKYESAIKYMHHVICFGSEEKDDQAIVEMTMDYENRNGLFKTAFDADKNEKRKDRIAMEVMLKVMTKYLRNKVGDSRRMTNADLLIFIQEEIDELFEQVQERKNAGYDLNGLVDDPGDSKKQKSNIAGTAIDADADADPES